MAIDTLIVEKKEAYILSFITYIYKRTLIEISLSR